MSTKDGLIYRKEKSMKTLEEIHQIREQKRKELDLRVNIKADTRENIS